MVQFSRSLFLLSLFAVGFNTPVKRTVAQVETDLTNIQTQVTSLDTAIQGFPASGLAGALGIHTAGQALITTLNSATTDVKNTPTVSEADGSAILAQVLKIEPIILDALKRISGDEAAFASQPIAGLNALVLQDLEELQTATQAFEAALIAEAPADLKPTATAIKTAIDAAFTTAIDAYE